MRIIHKGKVKLVTNSEEIRDKFKEGQGVWHATVMSLDEILVRTGRKPKEMKGHVYQMRQ